MNVSGGNKQKDSGPDIMAHLASRQVQSVQQVYLDADYWYHKGVVLNQKQENNYALNCYRQALKLNPNHKASIFNLACAFEKIGSYKEALEWFTHAINVDEKWPDAHYGLALCSLKLNLSSEAVGHIENAMKWNVNEYNIKVEKRRVRALQRERERQEEAEKMGAASPLMKQKDGLEAAEIECTEDEDE